MPRGALHVGLFVPVWPMSDTSASDMLRPPASEWASLLASNRQLLNDSGDVVVGVSRQALRAQLLEAAFAFTQELCSVAVERGVVLPAVPAPEADRPLVMTGHQPLVYHSGLLFKEETLNSFSRTERCTALSVTIDSDEGDGGRVLWPAIEGSLLAVREGSLVRNREGLYRDQLLADEEEVGNVFGQMLQDLRDGGMSQCEESVLKAKEIYCKLSGVPIVKAHSIARRAMAGFSHLELPLTHVALLPEARKFFEGMVTHAGEVAALYNTTLDGYRASHKIRNAANPFPNMKVGEDSVELPLWLLSGSARVPVRANRMVGASLPEGVVVPRGSIVTLLLRAFCADFFIHGLGGGKYDQFVDSFGSCYLKSALPLFVVASRTRYLFPDKVRSLEAELDLKSALKNVVSHPQNFLRRGLFSSEEEQELLAASNERAELLAALKSATDAAERSRVAHQLNALNSRIREFLEKTPLYSRLQSADCSDAALKSWSFREFPFFMWKAGRLG